MSSKKDKEKAYRLELWRINGVGIKTFARLVKMFGSSEVIWNVSGDDLLGVLANKKLVDSI